MANAGLVCPCTAPFTQPGQEGWSSVGTTPAGVSYRARLASRGGRPFARLVQKRVVCPGHVPCACCVRSSAHARPRATRRWWWRRRGQQRRSWRWSLASWATSWQVRRRHCALPLLHARLSNFCAARRSVAAPAWPALAGDVENARRRMAGRQLSRRTLQGPPARSVVGAEHARVTQGRASACTAFPRSSRCATVPVRRRAMCILLPRLA